MPGSTVAIKRGGGTASAVKPMKSGRRMPARSATPPRKGDVTATSPIETETTRPHQRSPAPASLPTTARA
jgi:hypothetical protein